MSKHSVTVAGCILTMVLLTGCAASGGSPAAQPTVEPTATPTAVPTTDPTEMPVNRFGLDCASLVSENDFAAIFGESLPLNPNDYFVPHATEGFIADGALVCFWGDGTTPGAGAPYLEIFAGPSDGAVAAGSATLEEETCFGGPSTLDSCYWNRITDDVWVSVSFHNLLENQVDWIQGTEYDAAPRPGSESELLVSRISDQLSAAPLEPVRAPRGSLSSCDAIVDWSVIAAELGTPEYSVHDGGRDFGWFKETGIDPAGRQSVRECNAYFRDPSDVSKGADVSVSAVPGGEWVERSGLRPGWAGEECPGSEGTEACYLGQMVGSTAVSVYAWTHRSREVTEGTEVTEGISASAVAASVVASFFG